MQFFVEDTSDPTIEDVIDWLGWVVIGCVAIVLVAVAILVLVAYWYGTRKRGESRRHDPGVLQLLYDLLPRLFQTEELRRMLHIRLPDGDKIVQNLPSTSTSPAEFVYQVALAVIQHGLVGELFDMLFAARPKQAAEIERVRKLARA